MADDKRDRAYDFLLNFVESSPEAAARELLLACFNILSADAFVDMAEVEFGWEDEEDIEEEEEEEEEEPLKHWSNTDGLPACGEGGHSSACTAYPAAVSCPECFELMEAASEDPPGGLDPSTPDGWDNSTGKE